VTTQTEGQTPVDLARLRIDRDAGPGRPSPLRAARAALALVAAATGVIACVLAFPVHGLSPGTTNMASFSEVAFKFRITPTLLGAGLLFAALTGAAGGLLSAIRAARIPVARALREI
jgi:putative ABC transport system permease protein